MIALPEVAALEITYRCNHQCVFCSCPWESGNVPVEEELTVAQWISAVRKLRKRGVRTVSLSGGEPTMKPGFMDIVDAACHEGLNVCLISNGRNLNRDMLAAFKERGIALSLSVPGIASFEKQTGYDGVEHVMQLFRWAREFGMDVTANIAVTKNNIGELYENIAYPLVNGARYVLLNRFLPGGRGLSNTEYLLSVEEINAMLDVAETVLRKAGAYGHIGTELPYCAVKDPEMYEYLKIGYQCGAAKTFFAIDPSGYVKVCNHSEQRLCKVADIDSLMANPYWTTFVERRYLPGSCAGCKDAALCDGGCREAAHVYGGSVDALDPCLNAGA